MKRALLSPSPPPLRAQLFPEAAASSLPLATHGRLQGSSVGPGRRGRRNGRLLTSPGRGRQRPPRGPWQENAEQDGADNAPSLGSRGSRSALIRALHPPGTCPLDRRSGRVAWAFERRLTGELGSWEPGAEEAVGQVGS